MAAPQGIGPAESVLDAGPSAPLADAPPRRRRRSQRQVEESEQNRAEIVRSALVLFAAHGFTKTTLHGVADRVGLTRQGILHHFGSKDGLFLEVLEESHRWAGRQSEATGASYGVQGLRELSNFVGHSSDDVHVRLAHTLLTEAMHEDAPPHVVSFARRRIERINGHITERLREAQDEGAVAADLDVATVATMMTGTITGLQAQALIDESLGGVSALDQLIDLLLTKPAAPQTR